MSINLVLVKKNGKRKVFSLPSSVTVMGRRHDCDVRIPLMSISRKHCEINHSNGVLKIRDLGSRNGTYLNGKRIDEASIQAKDSIKVGPLTFMFETDGQSKGTAQKSPGEDKGTEDITDDFFASLEDSEDSGSSPDTADSFNPEA